MRAPQKRILFARSADACNINAQAKNAQSILSRWRSSECRPAIFSFYSPHESVAANPNVDIIRIAPNRLWRAAVFAAYLRRFDAVICPGIHHFADWAALKFRAWLGRPLAIIETNEGLLGVEGDPASDQKYTTIAGHPAISQKVPRAVWQREDELHRMARHIIAISPYLARQTIAEYPAVRVSTLPLGVELGVFGRTRWQRRSRPRVVCAANVRVHKRPHFFLELARCFPGADFIWFGEGDLRSRLNGEAAKAGLGNLFFPGSLSLHDLAREFAASDIMVLPSHSEGVPKVTQEAAACGLAQIVFGFYEPPSVIDGVNGHVVWSDQEMTERLGALLDDPGRIAQFGRAGMRMAEAWSWDIIAPQWERLIVAAVGSLPTIPGKSHKAPPACTS